MAEEKKKGGGRSRPRGKALRYLFATGVLSGTGGKKGKGPRKVTYHKDKAASLKSAKGTKSKAGVVGGSKAAGLRSGAGGGKSRAERIAAGRAIANRPDVARKALKGSGLRVGEYKDKGPRILGTGNGPLTATGKRTRMAGDTRFLVRSARKQGQLPERWTPPARADHSATRAARIAAGRKQLAGFANSEAGRRAGSQIPVFTAANGGNRKAGLREFNGLRRRDAQVRRRMHERGSLSQTPAAQARQARIDKAKATLNPQNRPYANLRKGYDKFEQGITSQVGRADSLASRAHQQQAIQWAYMRRAGQANGQPKRAAAAPRPQLQPARKTIPKADRDATRAARIAAGRTVAREQLGRLYDTAKGSSRQSVSNLLFYRDNPRWAAQIMTGNKKDSLSPKRLKALYGGVRAVAQTTRGSGVLKANWPRRS